MSSNMIFLILSVLATIIATVLITVFQPEILGFREKVRKNEVNLPKQGVEIL